MEKMFLPAIQGIEIFRPREAIECELRRAAESHLRDKFAPGERTSREEINAILQHQFGFFGSILEETLPIIASWHVMEFLLHQYDQSARLELLRKQGQLTGPELVSWQQTGPGLRRAVKFLAERMALVKPAEEPAAIGDDILVAVEKATICAEQLVYLYTLSDQTHAIFPDTTTLVVGPPGSDYYLDLTVKDFDRHTLLARLDRDMRHQSRFIPNPPFQFDAKAIADVLDEPFKQVFGFGVYDGLAELYQMIRTADQKAVTGFDVPFCNQKLVIETTATNLGTDPEKAGRFLSGFTIPAERMANERRAVWKPKQEYRAYRRGFFEFPHPTGTHLIWSRALAGECTLALRKRLCFQQIPLEWEEPVIRAGLAELSNRAGKWFEGVVQTVLKAAGFLGGRSYKGSIGRQPHRIDIPAEVGEIDYLAYLPAERLLVVLECKNVDSGFEPKFFRDDIDQFVTGKKSYAKKFRKKVDWVRQHLLAVCAALESEALKGEVVRPELLGTAMVTPHPTIAASFIPDFPCVSITELMLDREEAKKWPYDQGAFSMQTNRQTSE